MILSYETIFIQFIFKQMNFGLQCNEIVLCIIKSSTRFICVGSRIGLHKARMRQTSLNGAYIITLWILTSFSSFNFNSRWKKEFLALSSTKLSPTHRAKVRKGKNGGVDLLFPKVHSTSINRWTIVHISRVIAKLWQIFHSKSVNKGEREGRKISRFKWEIALGVFGWWNRASQRVRKKIRNPFG